VDQKNFVLLTITVYHMERVFIMTIVPIQQILEIYLDVFMKLVVRIIFVRIDVWIFVKPILIVIKDLLALLKQIIFKEFVNNHANILTIVRKNLNVKMACVFPHKQQIPHQNCKNK